MPTATKFCPFTEDARTEAWLATFGVGWELVEIPIDDFNRTASKNNQARPEAFDSDVVDTYTVSMVNGEVFPALVMYESGTSGKKAIDGNHRYYGAAGAKASHYMAYMVDEDTDGEIIAAMTMSANTRNGLNVPKSFRVHQALHLTSLGYTDEVSAAMMSVKITDLKKLRLINSVTDRALRLGISATVWREVPDTIKARMSAIQMDTVFKDAMECIITTQIKSGPGLEEFYKGVRDAVTRSEQDALDYIGNVSRERRNAARLRAVQGRSHLSSPRNGFSSGIGKIMSVAPEQVNQIFVSNEDRTIATAKIDEALVRLAQLRSELSGRTTAANAILQLATRIENGDA